MDRKNTALSKATDFLRREIARARRCLDARLPPIRSLAAESGLSPDTLRKAAHLLQDEGLLLIRQGRGLLIPGMPSAGTVAEPHAAGWKALRTRLERDVLEGKYRSGEQLPSVKELSDTYGVNYRTLRKALDDMERGKLLVRRKRRLIVTGRNSRPSLTLLCVVDDSFYQNSWMGYYNSRALPFLQNLENLCAERNVAVVRVLISTWEERRPDLRNAVGVVLWLSSDGNNLFRRSRPFLRDFTKPILAIDWSGGFAPEEITTMKNLHIFRHGDLDAGIEAGRFLLRQGYRSVALFSFENKQWSRRRIEGITRALQSASCGAVAHPFLLDAELSHARQSDFRDTASARWKMRLDAINRSIRGVVSRESLSGQIEWMLYESLQHIWRSDYLEAAFSGALKLKDVTAWVLDCDTAACFNALPFLHSRGVKLPRQLSVLGFENTVLSFAHDLTSVDFCYGRLAGIVLRICLQYGKRAGPEEPRVRDIPMTVVERGSTRSC